MGMILLKEYEVIIIGGGPAGMAAALKVNNEGCKALIIEREERLGGILKQCIHDGFGVLKFNERLTGPEYALKYKNIIKNKDIDILLKTFVIEIKKDKDFHIKIINENGIHILKTKTVIFSTGCRERTSKQIFIQGERPAGIYNAGTAQYMTNIMGFMPGKNCIILGSGDIGLIMARRLTLEGAKVLGVYEIKDTPSGLTRNIRQCLYDYDIPLYLSHSITKIFGKERIEAVEISKVNKNYELIENSKKIIKCDTLILSVGLIPENELLEDLGITIDKKTNGAFVDNDFMSVEIPGIFICGNALHVNDLVDYVSESGEIAGKKACEYIKNKKTNNKNTKVDINENFLYIVPQYINENLNDEIIFYFRSKKKFENAKLKIFLDDKIVEKNYNKLIPAEMEKLTIKNIKNKKISMILE